MKEIKKVLVANRGEIACRIMRTCRKMGIATVAVYSEADEGALHVRSADEAVLIGPPEAGKSYLDIDKLIAAAKETGADAVHPGYGFLSENSRFIKACEEAGLTFIGPKSSAVEILGSKTASREKMIAAGVPVVPGIEKVEAYSEELAASVREIGYPVMVKAAAGGGGKGMRKIGEESLLEDAIASAKREAASAFGDDTVFIEKFIEEPRHIEIQVVTDKHGNAVHLFERECSIQRRHQKIIEEAPSSVLTQEQRSEMGEAAIKAVNSVGYDSVGTVEFIFGPGGEWYFLEVNTRVQVEHPVTEEVTGVDIIEHQIKIAEGRELELRQENLSITGHSIECRIYAEDGERDFMPSVGKIEMLEIPKGDYVRWDSGVEEGSIIGTFYDPIMAKLIVKGGDREEAIGRMQTALEELVLFGVRTSVGFMHRVISHEKFKEGDISTAFIERYADDLKQPEEARAGAAGALAAHLAAYHNEKQKIDVDEYDVWNVADGFRIGRV